MRGFLRVAAVVAAASFPLIGLTVNSASAKPKPKATPQISVTCSPNPVVETAQSIVNVVCQVEANPSFAGESVTLSSTQLASHCTGPTRGWETFTGGSGPSLTLVLDNDGNVTANFVSFNCAPGSALIDASLDAPPFSTALTKLVIEPPQVTPPGVHAFPNPEVEVGDNPTAATPNNRESEAEFIFYVETSPVYAEQTASITSDQLTERCGLGFTYFPASGGGAFFPPGTGTVITGPIDNDGNSVFSFLGASCAAGKSTVIAEIGGGGPTYSTQVTILPPAVTI
jgi:hypothetical protein